MGARLLLLILLDGFFCSVMAMDLPQPASADLPMPSTSTEVSKTAEADRNKIDNMGRLLVSDIPKPLPIQWDNYQIGRYFSSAMTKNGMPLPRPRVKTETVLSVYDAITLVLRDSQVVKNARMQRILDKYSFDISRNAYSWALPASFTFSGSYERGKKVSYSGNFLPSISMKTLYGTSISLTPNQDVSSPNPSATLSITQPLLTGLTDNKMSFKDILDNEKKARDSYKSAIEGAVKSIVSDYVNQITSSWTLQNNLEDKVSAQESVRQARIKYHYGKISRNDLNSSEASLVDAEISYQNEVTTINNTQKDFVNSLGLSPGARIKVDQKKGMDFLSVMKKPPMLEAITIALEKNIDYQQSVMDLRAAQRSVQSAREKLGVQLSLQFDHTLATTSGDPSRNKLTLNMTVPVDTHSAQQSLISARIAYEEKKVDFRNKKSDLVRKIEQSYQTLDNDRFGVKKSIDSEKLNESLKKNAVLKQSLNKVSAIDVEQARKNLISSQQSVITAKLAYFNHLTDLHILLGDYLDIWNIKLRY